MHSHAGYLRRKGQAELLRISLLAKFAEHPFHDVGEEGKKRNYGSRGSSGSSGKGGVVTIASFVLSTIAITSSCSGWGTSNLSSVR